MRERLAAGRPTSFSERVSEEICDLIIEGWSVRQIGARDDMPAECTIYRWLARHEDFREKYARAKELQADRFGEEILEIADDGTNDWMERQQRDETIRVVDHEHINRSRLRVDARKWLMSKLAPKKYGDKLDVAHSGSLTLEQMVLASFEKPAGGNE